MPQPNKQQVVELLTNPIVKAWIKNYRTERVYKWQDPLNECIRCGWPHAKAEMCGYGATFGQVKIGKNFFYIHAGNVEYMLDFMKNLGKGFHWEREIFFGVEDGNVLVTHIDKESGLPSQQRWVITPECWKSIVESVGREISLYKHATPISPTPSGHYKDALIEDLDNRKEVTPSQQEAKPKAGETWYILHQDARACRTVTIAEITEATVLFEPERYVSSGERVPLNRVKFIELARPDEVSKP